MFTTDWWMDKRAYSLLRNNRPLRNFACSTQMSAEILGQKALRLERNHKGVERLK